MNIVYDYVPESSKKRTGRKMTPTTLTIHSTANTKSTARNERDYLTNPSNTSSTGYHMVVDETQCICCIPFTEVAYHAGDGANGPGNTTSVALEICESGDREKTLKHAAEVAAWFLKGRGWGTDKLRQHYNWSGKNCPRILRDTGRWPEFVQMVQNNLNAGTTAEEQEVDDEVIETKTISIDGTNYSCNVINKDDYNFLKMADLRQAGYTVTYDATANLPGMAAPQTRADVPDASAEVQAAIDTIKEKCGLEDQTIQYLMKYQYGDDLLTKLANGMK